MAVIEAYFDESYDGRNAQSKPLCLAGYLFEKQNCQSLDLAWRSVLDREKLPYFHMVDCAHGAPPFDRIDPQRRDLIARDMIGIIRKHMLFGSAIAVDEVDYNSWFCRKTLGSAYTYCCWQTLASISVWLDRNGFDGQVSYFFEAGHAGQNEASRIMNRIFSDPFLKKAYRYRTHGFVQKECSRPVQAADLFAWQHLQFYKRLVSRRPQRADFKELVREREYITFIANRKTAAPILVYGEPDYSKVSGTFGGRPFLRDEKLTFAEYE